MTRRASAARSAIRDLMKRVVRVGADVGIVVVAAVHDLRVGLAVVRVDDHVDPAHPALGRAVDDGAAVLDLDVVEGPGRGRVVLIDAADLAELACPESPAGSPAAAQKGRRVVQQPDSDALLGVILSSTAGPFTQALTAEWFTVEHDDSRHI